MNTVYTFHIPVQGLEDLELIELWKLSWSKHGWSPQVLTEHDAQNHPDYIRIRDATHLYRTTNPKDYERACYIRWLALELKGGGFMSDADVINYGFTPEDASRAVDHFFVRPVLLSGGACPCITYAAPIACKAIIKMFTDYEDKPVDSTQYLQQNVSDQNLFDANPSLGVAVKYCWNHKEPGWETAKMAHYNNASFGRIVKRSQEIPRIRPI